MLDKKTISFIDELLRIGEKDLSASEILYNTKFYPQAIYLLSQAFEKIAKAYYLSSGIITIEDLNHNISHQVYKGSFLEVKRLLEKYPEYSNKSLEKIFKDYFTKKPSNKTRKSLYFKKDKIINLIEKTPCEKDEIRLKDFFNHEIPPLERIRKKVNLNKTIILLGLIISPHEEVSRYPNKFKSPLNYDENTGIVQAFESLLLRTVEVLALVDKNLSLLKLKK